MSSAVAIDLDLVIAVGQEMLDAVERVVTVETMRHDVATASFIRFRI